MNFIIMKALNTEKEIAINLSNINQIKPLIYQDRCQVLFNVGESVTVMHSFEEIMNMIMGVTNE